MERQSVSSGSEQGLEMQLSAVSKGGSILTDREIEVLRRIFAGRSNKEAASDLCCSKRTIDFHLARVYQKLDVNNRVQAMRRVADMGLFPLDSGDSRTDN